MNMSDKFLEQLDPTRRSFIKKLVAAGAAAPVVATFSIDALSQAINSSRTGGSSFSACQPDLGYVGPTAFAAHLAYAGPPQDFGARVNGELRLAADDDGGHGNDDDAHGNDGGGHRRARKQRIQTNLQLVDGAVFGNAQILINGNTAVSLNSGKSYIDASSLFPGACDLDFLLNAMAAGQATVLVAVSYLGNALNLTGGITPAGPGFDFASLKA
jgi:hypothetical protein